jgi:hypothetical protein
MKPNLRMLLSYGFLANVILALMLYQVFYMLSHDWVAAGLLSGFFGSGLIFLRRHYFDFLAMRINAKEPVEWTVEINGVSVGTMKDSEYAAIRRHVFSDLCNYFDQVMNAGTVLLRLIGHFYIGIPLALFWIGLALAIGSPETFTDMAAEIGKNGAAAVAAAAFLMLKAFGLLSLMLVVMHVVCGFSRYGFIDRFDVATREIVRRRFGVVADGRVLLVRWDKGAPLFYNEWASVQQSLAARLAKRER